MPKATPRRSSSCSGPRTISAPADHVKLLLGKDATRKNILDALHWLEKSAKRGRSRHPGDFRRRGTARRALLLFRRRFDVQESHKDAVASGDIQPIIAKLASERFVAMIDVHFMGFDAGKEKAPEPSSSNFYRDSSMWGTNRRITRRAGSSSWPAPPANCR